MQREVFDTLERGKVVERVREIAMLQRYLDINAKWVNDQGMQWDFPTLVREEMRQPVRTAACGGTHRLFAAGDHVLEDGKHPVRQAGRGARMRDRPRLLRGAQDQQALEAEAGHGDTADRRSTIAVVTSW